MDANSTPALSSDSRLIEELYPAFLDSLLAGNRTHCSALVNGLLEQGVAIRALYVDLFQRALYEVGDLWETNRISVAREHLATSITEGLLNLVYPVLFGGERNGRRAVVSCVANEYHQVGGKMVADILELHGWDAYFLGANTPTRELLKLIEEKQPHLLCLSVSIYFNLPHLAETLRAVRTSWPQLQIFVGGQAFRWGGGETVTAFPHVAMLGSLAELEERLGGM